MYVCMYICTRTHSQRSDKSYIVWLPNKTINILSDMILMIASESDGHDKNGICRKLIGAK